MRPLRGGRNRGLVSSVVVGKIHHLTPLVRVQVVLRREHNVSADPRISIRSESSAVVRQARRHPRGRPRSSRLSTEDGPPVEGCSRPTCQLAYFIKLPAMEKVHAID
jgi:hypothetical protein